MGRDVLFILVKVRLNYILKLQQSAWSRLNFSSCTNCRDDFIIRTENVVLLSNLWWRSLGKKSERFYKNSKFWNNFESLSRVDLTLLKTRQKTIQYLWVTWKGRKQTSRLCVTKKKIVIFAAPLIYLNYAVDDSLKTVMLKIFGISA